MITTIKQNCGAAKKLGLDWLKCPLGFKCHIGYWHKENRLDSNQDTLNREYRDTLNLFKWGHGVSPSIARQLDLLRFRWDSYFLQVFFFSRHVRFFKDGTALVQTTYPFTSFSSHYCHYFHHISRCTFVQRNALRSQPISPQKARFPGKCGYPRVGGFP